MRRILFALFLLSTCNHLAFSEKVTVKEGGIVYNVDTEKGTAGVGCNYVTDKDSGTDNRKGTLSGEVNIAPEVRYRGKKYPVTSIEPEAFSGCSGITSIFIPGTIVYIENGVFSFRLSNLRQIIVSPENQNFKSVDGVLFSKDMMTLIRYPLGSSATEYVIPSSVISIEKKAFTFCSNLRRVVMPDGLKYIRDNAFDYCRIDSVKIPETVIEIGESAFNMCSDLTSVVIPKNVKTVGPLAFNYCYHLKSVICRNKDLVFPPDAFSKCDDLNGNIVYILDIQEVIELAGKGNPEYQYRLGMSYLKGEGLQADPAAAKEWLERSAEGGYVLSQVTLGDMYLRGSGTEKNLTEAIKWYTMAADKGNVDAQSFVGDCYFNAMGVKQNLPLAVAYYKTAAEKGNENATRQLGYCYYYGRGIARDYKEAGRWYLESAKKGNAESAFSVALMLFEGKGMEKNFTEALYWTEKALDGGITRGRWLYCELAYNDALSSMESGNFSSAISRLTSVIEYDKENVNAYINRGFCYLSLKPEDYSGAESDFKKALELDKDNEIALGNLRIVENYYRKQEEIKSLCDKGYDYFLAKDYTNAVSNYAKAISIDEANPDPYCCIGYCYFACELYSEAIGFFDKALAIDPGYQEAIDARRNTRIIMISNAISNAASNFSNSLNNAYNNSIIYDNSSDYNSFSGNDSYLNNTVNRTVDRERRYGNDRYKMYMNLYEQESAEADSYLKKYQIYGNPEDLQEYNNCQSRASEYLETAKIWE